MVKYSFWFLMLCRDSKLTDVVVTPSIELIKMEIAKVLTFACSIDRTYRRAAPNPHLPKIYPGSWLELEQFVPSTLFTLLCSCTC